MMYEVYVDNELLFYPNDDERLILNATIDQSLNEAGVFECDVPSINPMYDLFNQRSSMIRVLKDGDEVFYGEIREITQNFDFTKHIYAVGELAFLFDSIQPQARYQGTPDAMFTAIITHHNNQVEDRKKFTKGNVLVVDPNDYVYHYTNYEDTLTALREKMCNTLNGYLRVRKVGGVRYLDLVPLNLYGTYCDQKIEFGENMLDYSCNITTDSIATAVIPLGAKIDEDQRTKDAVKGLDEYVTIKSVNNGVDYLYNQEAVNRHGWVKVVHKWNDVNTPSILLTKAREWLTSAQYATMTLQLNAVDLSILNADIDTFEVGNIVHAVAEPFGMDTTFPVQKKKTYLNDLSKNYITLSNTAPLKSYTSQASNAVSLVQSQIPSTTPILEEAKARALAMLLDETTGGHVVFEYDADNKYIEAVSICNASTIDASTTRWRWSMGAFGYLKRENVNQPWTDVGVAMNANGEIVADFITAGSLNSNVIKASSITTDKLAAGAVTASKISVSTLSAISASLGVVNVGGKDNGNGRLSVKNASGSETVSLSKDGITANYGEIGGFSIGTNRIGDSDGDKGACMKTSGLVQSWSAGEKTEVNFGKVYVSTGSKTDRGVKVYSGSNNNGHSILVGHASVYSDQHGDVQWSGSDRNIKRDIEDLPEDYALALLQSLKPRQYQFMAEDGERYGFIAQEVRETLDDLGRANSRLEYETTYDGVTMCQLNYTDFSSIIVKVVQQQQREIEKLKTLLSTTERG